MVASASPLNEVSRWVGHSVQSRLESSRVCLGCGTRFFGRRDKGRLPMARTKPEEVAGRVLVQRRAERETVDCAPVQATPPTSFSLSSPRPLFAPFISRLDRSAAKAYGIPCRSYCILRIAPLRQHRSATGRG